MALASSSRGVVGEEPPTSEEPSTSEPSTSAGVYLSNIYLSNNQISDAGVAALASALRGGALPSCTRIDLDGNPGSRAPVDEALASPERAAALARRQAE